MLFSTIDEMRGLTSGNKMLRLAMLAGERKRQARMANIMQRGQNQLAVQRLSNAGATQRARIASATQRENTATNALARLSGIEAQGKNELRAIREKGNISQNLERLRGSNVIQRLLKQDELNRAAEQRMTAQKLAGLAASKGAINENAFSRLIGGGDQFNAPDLSGVDVSKLVEPTEQVTKGRYQYVKPTLNAAGKVVQPGFIMDTATGQPVNAIAGVGQPGGGAGGGQQPQQQVEQVTTQNKAAYQTVLATLKSMPDDNSAKAYLRQLKQRAPALYYQILSDLEGESNGMQQSNPLLPAL